MDINDLFTDAGMRAFTASQRDQHLQDASQYQQLAAVLQARLQQSPIDGDKHGSYTRRRRAWRVVRHMRAMARASRRIAADCEALYATYLHEVVELPGRREQAELTADARRARRRALTTAFVANSLEKSAGAHQGQGGAEPDFLGAEPFTFPQAAGGENQQLTGIDRFLKGGA